MKQRLAEIRRAAGRRPGTRPLSLVQQVAYLRWQLGIARRDAKADAGMRRNAERRAARAERHQARLERRIRWLVRIVKAYRDTKVLPLRSGRHRRTWFTDAMETTALPAHRWESLKAGGMIR